MTAGTKMPRVLVAEDDEAVRGLLATTLRRRRMEVQLARNGDEALQSLERERWDVLVLDLMMPQVNGWEVMDWLSAHPERRPTSVIVVSATDRDLLRDLDTSVVNAIIFKPFDVMQLGLGHRQVEDDDGVRLFAQKRERVTTICRGIDGEAFAAKDGGDQRSDTEVVVDHQCAPLCRASGMFLPGTRRQTGLGGVHVEATKTRLGPDHFPHSTCVYC